MNSDSEDNSDDNEELQLDPKVLRRIERRIRGEVTEGVRAEIRQEFEQKYKNFKHLVPNANDSEQVLVQATPTTSTSLVESDEVIFIEEVRPRMEIIPAPIQNPIDGIYSIPEALTPNPHLKVSKTLFKRLAVEKKNSNRKVCQKAICLLLKKPETAFETITKDDYAAACKLPFRKVKPTGKARAVCYFAVPPKSKNEPRSLRVYRKKRKIISPHERVCSECFRYGTGTSESYFYNDRLVCTSCGDQDMFMGRIYSRTTEEEELIVPFTRSFKITLPYLQREEKAKVILSEKAGLKNAKEKLLEEEKKDLKLIRSKSICSSNKNMVVNHVSCLKMAYLIRSLFKDPNGRKIRLNFKCVQFPKHNLQVLIQELRTHKITISAKLTDEQPPSLPSFIRPYKDGDIIGVIYQRYNYEFDYAGKRYSASGRKNNTDASTADQLYEQSTGRKLEEKKKFTSPEQSPRSESIVHMAYAVAYFLQLTNPLTGNPVQLGIKEVAAGEFDYNEDGKNILEMVDILFNAKVEVNFDS